MTIAALTRPRVKGGRRISMHAQPTQHKSVRNNGVAGVQPALLTLIAQLLNSLGKETATLP
eukprot:1140012-Pelagomonas_calceolata.AAC.1